MSDTGRDDTDSPNTSTADDGFEWQDTPDSSEASDATEASCRDADTTSSEALPESHETDRLAELEAEVERLEQTITDLEAKNEALDEENAELRSALGRTRTEFEEYKDRAKKREAQAEQAAITDLVEDMATVRDSLSRALDHDEQTDLRDGILSTLNNFDAILNEHGISIIDPDPGATPDAQRHEVMMKDADETVADGDILSVVGVGYERDETVLKPAQVIVSSGPATDDTDQSE